MGLDLRVRLPISAGHVICPARRRRVDVDACHACPALVDGEHGHAMRIVCRPSRRTALGAWPGR
jgi:hypothetical protein